MKNIIFNFLKGFCIGTAILVYSLALGEIFAGGIEEYIVYEFIRFFILNIIFGIFIGIGLCFSEKNKNIDIVKRKRTLKKVMKIILGLIFICMITLVISLIFKNVFACIISIFLIIALSIWYGGAKLGYKVLDKE